MKAEWISIQNRLPLITDEKSFVEVLVRTTHNGIGKMMFGYSGAMGETPGFCHPIRDFKGDVHIENKIVDWKPLEK